MIALWSYRPSSEHGLDDALDILDSFVVAALIFHVGHNNEAESTAEELAEVVAFGLAAHRSADGETTSEELADDVNREEARRARDEHQALRRRESGHDERWAVRSVDPGSAASRTFVRRKQIRHVTLHDRCTDHYCSAPCASLTSRSVTI
jgi:hypothetical protein